MNVKFLVTSYREGFNGHYGINDVWVIPVSTNVEF
jgi:hypothetical protein